MYCRVLLNGEVFHCDIVCVYVFCFGYSFESMKQLCERYNRAVANIKKLVRLLKGIGWRGEGRGCGEGNESERRWEERGRRRGRGRGKRED